MFAPITFEWFAQDKLCGMRPCSTDTTLLSFGNFHSSFKVNTEEEKFNGKNIIYDRQNEAQNPKSDQLRKQFYHSQYLSGVSEGKVERDKLKEEEKKDFLQAQNVFVPSYSLHIKSATV